MAPMSLALLLCLTPSPSSLPRISPRTSSFTCHFQQHFSLLPTSPFNSSSGYSSLSLIISGDPYTCSTYSLSSTYICCPQVAGCLEEFLLHWTLSLLHLHLNLSCPHLNKNSILPWVKLAYTSVALCFNNLNWPDYSNYVRNRSFIVTLVLNFFSYPRCLGLVPVHHRSQLQLSIHILPLQHPLRLDWTLYTKNVLKTVLMIAHILSVRLFVTKSTIIHFMQQNPRISPAAMKSLYGSSNTVHRPLGFLSYHTDNTHTKKLTIMLLSCGLLFKR